MKTTIIAEAGVNHNGDPNRALALVDAAADAGADCVKFQTFRPEETITAGAPKAAYQKEHTGADETQLEMARRLTLDDAVFFRLADRCAARGIAFLSTPFDLFSIDFLAHRMGLTTLKLPSGEITNGPYLLAAARTGTDIILSTGMSTLDDVETALAVLSFGFVRPLAQPSTAAIFEVYRSDEGRSALQGKVSVLHCTTEYPAPFADVNLRAMDSLSDAFGLPVGLSDHTPGIAVPIAAAARGAVIIEKHVTVDRSLPGPDHKASLEPGELTAMVDGIRSVEKAMGDGEKRPMPSELKNMPVARRSLVARTAIRAGETFTEENLCAKRPGTGISPMGYWDWLGRTAVRDYAADEPVEG